MCSRLHLLVLRVLTEQARSVKNCKKALSIVLADDSPYIVVKVLLNEVIWPLAIIDYSVWRLHCSHYLPLLSTSPPLSLFAPLLSTSPPLSLLAAAVDAASTCAFLPLSSRKESSGISVLRNNKRLRSYCCAAHDGDTADSAAVTKETASSSSFAIVAAVAANQAVVLLLLLLLVFVLDRCNNNISIVVFVVVDASLFDARIHRVVHL